MKILIRFLGLFTFRTLGVATLAVFFTYLCNAYGWTAELPSTLIGIAVIFPIVFSIEAAYRRREDARRDDAARSR